MPQLGAFSLSLTVKDLQTSREFYAKLGFDVVMGEIEQNWLILRNGETTIGLFHGMFDQNTLTFNPGWDREAQPLAEFQDVRAIQAELEAKGIELKGKAEGEAGPAHLFLLDPDGNPILIDQHV